MKAEAARTPAAAHLARLADWFALSGKTVVDVGCGTGAFLDELAGAGALPVGIEIERESVARAKAAIGDRADVRLGRAEALPLENASADGVCFIFSLHHVPGELHGAAIAEAARVLSPGGRLHVADPLPFGEMTEVLTPIEDEVSVRSAAQRFLHELHSNEFRLEHQAEYVTERSFPTLDAFLAHVIRVDPARAIRAADPYVREEVARRFARVGRRSADGVRLAQPCIAFHFLRLPAV